MSDLFEGRLPDLFDLSGKVAVVTGSSQGIGRACAERMAQHGARVVFTSRTLADCEARARAVNEWAGEERAIAIRCDTSERDQVSALISDTVAHFGRLDIVVGNALADATGTSWVEKFDEDELTYSLVGNITNNAFLAKLAVPHLRVVGGGSIVFTSSVAGIVPLEDYLHYGVSKAGLAHLARILAVQLGPLNIRVNCLLPGVVAARGLESEAWADGERARVVTGPTPLGGPGTTDEMAGFVVWLVSPSGAFATGQNFAVDGGQSIKGMNGPHDMWEIARARARAQRAG